MKRLALILVLAMSIASAANATMPATAPAPTTAPSRVDQGPDVVVMDELVELYEPVPFDHKTHAQMAEMWDGCVTCHHRSPQPATQASAIPEGLHPARTQDESAEIPACKSCHAPAADDDATLHMPSLKGAYHRQCLSCHRDWSGENACVICHAPLNGHALASTTRPSTDDIVGRMHPPIPEPTEKLYVARFTPVAGPNVLFRHGEHTTRFGMRCVQCHRRDNCADCHSNGNTASPVARPRPLHPGRTWHQTHGPCVSCHVNDACDRCHYQSDASPPPPFEHASTGQLLDEDHASLKCADCHDWLKGPVGCGDASCHSSRAVAFPTDRPGPVIAMPDVMAPTTLPASAPATQPATRPTIIRIRRGGM